MRKKKLWLVEIIVTLLAVYSIIMTFIQLGNCQNQVDFSPRGNVLNVLSPTGIFSAGRAVLEDSDGNLYISDLGADTDTIQKFNQDGKYICSYFVNNKERSFWIENRKLSVIQGEDGFEVYVDDQLVNQCSYEKEQETDLRKFIQDYGSEQEDTDLICVFSSNEIILYAKDCLLGSIPLSKTEIEEFAEAQQESEGSLFLWTVHMDDGRKIKLEKIFNSDVCFGSLFDIFVEIAIILGMILSKDEKVDAEV